MSVKFAAMMPRVLNRALNAFAWLCLPLWGGAITGWAGALDDSGVMLLVGAAATSTGCMLRVMQENRQDARVALLADCHSQCEAQMAALAAVMADSGLMKVAPIPQPAPAPDRLHLVEGAS